MIHDTEWMDIPSDDMDLDQARQAVRELRKKVIELSNHHETVTEFADRCRECGKMKKGKWVNNIHDIPICDQCGYMTPYDRAIDDYEYGNYCPNCGAKMQEVEE